MNAISPALPQSDGERFQLLVNAVTDYAIYMLDPQGYVTSWNAGAQRFKGYSSHEIIGEHFSRFYTEEDRAAGAPQRALATAEREGKFEIEAWRVRKDGTRFWASVVVDAIRDDSGRLIGFAKVTRDLTERMAALQALRESERQFRLLVQGVTDYAIYMLDPTGTITSWNAGAERIKGFAASEVLGTHFSRFYTEEDALSGLPRVALATAAREGRFEKEGWRVRKDGTRFWANVVIDPIRDETGTLIGFAKITRDMTERREAQQALDQARAALFQAQKMETVGQLTGGIAHDFNNLLTVIVNSLDLLGRSVEDARGRRLIDNAQRASERAARLTQQLLAFSRRQPLRPEIHSPDRLIDGFEAVLRRACGETVQFETDLATGGATINVDAPQFEAALLNLTVNARDAMPEGGTLRISTAPGEVDEKRARLMSGIRPGPYVVISVTDTGVGMEPTVVERAMEPFFTTKEVGKGTGLGLSQVYGFVTQSGGHLELESAIGQGTTVRLYLPHVEGEAVRELERTEQKVKAQFVGTVLIVEDEAEVLEVAVEIFRSLGYDVLTAPDAPAAVEILKRDRHIDVLFTDVVMPKGMNGIELARQARELRSDLRVLLASGYPMSALPEGGAFLDETSFISKPYRWTELNDKLRALR